LIESELKDKVVAAINLSSDGVTIQGKKIVLDGDTDVLGTFNVDGTLNIKGKSISQAAINIKHAVVDSVLLTPPEGTQTIVSVATDTATWNVLTVTPFDDTYRGLVVYHTATPMEGLLGGYEIQLGDNGTDWGPRISNLHYIADQYLFLPDNTMINFGHLFVQNDLVCFGYKNRTFGGPTTLWIRFRRMSVQV
jgi:hypothetical protein